MNDLEFKNALRGIDPHAPAGERETRQNTYTPPKTEKVLIGLADLVGKAHDDGYLYLDLLPADENECFYRSYRRNIDKYVAQHGLKVVTLLQEEKGKDKQLVLSKTAKTLCTVEFEKDLARGIHVIEIVARLPQSFIKFGDKKETGRLSAISALNYELPFYAESPVYGLIKVKESDLVSAVQYALADSRLENPKDCL